MVEKKTRNWLRNFEVQIEEMHKDHSVLRKQINVFEVVNVN